jgi:hypothetical protein
MLSEGLITNAATANDFAPLTRLPHHSSHTSHTDASSSPLRHAPTRIARTEYLRTGSLRPTKRAALIDELYAVYSETVHGLTRDELAGHALGAHDGRLALFYDGNEELVGFSYCRVDRIEHAGRTQAAFSAGVDFRLGYRGGAPSALFGLSEALRFKLLHPRTPLGYLTSASSPAAYHLLASTMPNVYPSIGHRTPADVEALVRELSRRWHYAPVGKDPWVVRSRAKPHNPSRLCRLRSPYSSFYTDRNPRFAEGEALLVWIPLDAVSILRGLFRTLRTVLNR